MLDIATLLVSMGLQQEMKEVRQEGVFVDNDENNSTEETVITEAAEVVSEALNTVEETVMAVAESMVPTFDMVSDVMPEAGNFEIDLSLPTCSSSKKA